MSTPLFLWGTQRLAGRDPSAGLLCLRHGAAAAPKLHLQSLGDDLVGEDHLLSAASSSREGMSDLPTLKHV